MEVLDEKGELVCWLSDDPDDWNSFSDYERKIRTEVLEYNEEAFCLGEHLLGYDWYEKLEFIKLLAKLNVNYTHHSKLTEKLNRIRTLAVLRLTSCHPDELDADRLSREWHIGDTNYKRADKLWKKGKRHKAIEYYEKSALYSFGMAYEHLGAIYEQGLGGFQQDIGKAIKYYEEGADDDIGDCAFTLGIIYRDGRKGLEVNYDEAYKWIRKASLLETCNAGNALGQLYENGWGCERNLRKALYWYDVSLTGIENGNRLRSVLCKQEDGLPLRLDGFDYVNEHYIQRASWWKEYYIKNSMLEL